ncbi:intraflagellar transport protein 22 homolog isoform X2 [Eurytemora carolleeae]|uniref:intraflagellar transport protein 22 homolog isoform X2 n=1 Tax=Eurytemora carolleeae TaxID=1294199 RepID=UPI000C75673B|nr:intraflagellar transport protein 22 homolog isoform X2 [Eurytemora carolleeae]XP_023326373.1 intraflagellar transport protein 22 homolog isoform X2 [Eurytemora carolleeae]|eukprot:XP_023326372.1 intraflagellar transport protein 22 homolog isoform X2 [Eurytemora affinis]
MYKVKILVVGPSQSGKTLISNFLSDATENMQGKYRPTVGVRILEFESSNLDINKKSGRAEVELWDTSGSGNYESCWPAIQKDAHGIVFVFNPDNSAHVKQLDSLYQALVQSTSMQDSNCVVFAHYLGSNKQNRGIKLSSSFSRHVSDTSVAGPRSIKGDFKCPELLSGFHSWRST